MSAPSHVNDDFAHLVEEHHRAVCAVAFSTLRDRAASEDIAQETFIVAWRKQASLTDRAEAAPWLCAIARNLARNAKRKRQPIAVDHEQLDALPTEARSPLDDALSREQLDAVSRALDELAPKYREAVVMHYRGQSLRQVARALDISEAAAKKRVSRGKQELAQTASLIERVVRKTEPSQALGASIIAAVSALPASAEAAGLAGGFTFGKLVAAVGVAAIAVAGSIVLVNGASPGEPGAAAAAASSQPAASAAAVARAASRDHMSRAGTAPAASSSASPAAAMTPARTHNPRERSKTARDEEVSHDIWTRLARRIDVHLEAADVRNVLRVVAEVAESDVLVDDAIDADVSVALRNATVAEALDEVLAPIDAEWREVPQIVIGPGSATGAELLSQRPVTLMFRDASLDDVMAAFGRALQIDILVEEGVEVAPISTSFDAVPLGRALQRVLADHGLGYETRSAIRVSPVADDAGDEADSEHPQAEDASR